MGMSPLPQPPFIPPTANHAAETNDEEMEATPGSQTPPARPADEREATANAPPAAATQATIPPANDSDIMPPPPLPNPYRTSTNTARATALTTNQPAENTDTTTNQSINGGGDSTESTGAEPGDTSQRGTAPVVEVDPGHTGRTQPPQLPDNGTLPLPTGATPTDNRYVQHRVWTEAELREEDPQLQVLTAADRKLMSVYGDTIHQNDGTHLDGGIGAFEDRKWQRLYKRIIACNLPLYDLPSGKYANTFLELQTQLWRDVRARKCNSEKALLFAPLILRKVKGLKTFSETKPIIWARLEAWKAERYVALVKSVEEACEIDGWHGSTNRGYSAECAGRKYNAMVMGGRMRAAVRMVCNQDKGGIFQPDDIDPKSGQPVLAVLRSKHPEPVIPEEDSFETYDNSEECLESMQLHAYEDQVAKSAAKLSGGAGPCGLDGVSLKYMLNHFEAHSEALRVEMGLWAEWLGNTSPPYAAYRALNAGRELPADKMPGVRPILAGEIWMRLISDVIHQQVKHTATQECGNVNLCAGLSAGIEGNLHAVHAIWPQ